MAESRGGRAPHGDAQNKHKSLKKKRARDNDNKNKDKTLGLQPHLLMCVCISALQYETQRLFLLYCSGLMCVGVKLECP